VQTELQFRVLLSDSGAETEPNKVMQSELEHRAGTTAAHTNHARVLLQKEGENGNNMQRLGGEDRYQNSLGRRGAS
jgi:hypothetical protein